MRMVLSLKHPATLAASMAARRPDDFYMLVVDMRVIKLLPCVLVSSRANYTHIYIIMQQSV